MPVSITVLEGIRDNLLVILAEITANPKPDYSVKGRSVSWSAYQALLLEQIKGLEEMINAQEPYIIVTRQVV